MVVQIAKLTTASMRGYFFLILMIIVRLWVVINKWTLVRCGRTGSREIRRPALPGSRSTTSYPPKKNKKKKKRSNGQVVWTCFVCFCFVHTYSIHACRLYVLKDMAQFFFFLCLGWVALHIAYWSCMHLFLFSSQFYFFVFTYGFPCNQNTPRAIELVRISPLTEQKRLVVQHI